MGVADCLNVVITSEMVIMLTRLKEKINAVSIKNKHIKS